MPHMMIVFEVHIAPGSDPAYILTGETLKDTGAQVMTREEAEKVGFFGLPELPTDHEVRYVAVAKRDERRVHSAIETSPAVGAFRKFEVE